MNKVICSSLLAAALAATSLTVACNGKVVQCNKLIDKLNSSQSVLKDGQGKLEGKDKAKEMGAFAGQLDQVKKDVTIVDVADAKLKGLQGDYVASLDKMAGGARTIEKAGDDATAAASGTKDLLAAVDDNSKVTDNINAYCTSP